jgi:DNA-binding SARP family transcriptional activator
VELYRELTESDPGHEQVWLALFRLHAQRGDRVGLLREERRMRQVLREFADEFGPTDAAEAAEMSADAAREFQRLLASLREREPAPA